MVHDVADFLRRHAPFDALEPAALAGVAAAAEIEFHPAGAVVFEPGTAATDHLWVVRSGAVQLLEADRVLDVLGEGELLGHPSMLGGLGPGVEARAVEDALLYRFPAAAVAPELERLAALRPGPRSLREGPGPPVEAARTGGVVANDPGYRPVGALIRAAPVSVRPETPIREAARRLGAAGATALVVDAGDGRLGIVTDRDLRSRVATGEVPVDAPVSSVMTPEAFTVAPEQLGGDVLIELLDRGIRHAPVVDASGSVLGILDDLDLLASAARTPFRLRRAITEARTPVDLARLARTLPETVVALSDAGLAAPRIALVSATVLDALTRRLVELAIDEQGPPPVAFSWLALGSHGRRELVPSSDADTGLVWFGPDGDAEIRAAIMRLADVVTRGLEACGVSADDHGVRADRLLFARSEDAWRAAVAGWIDDPHRERALIAVSVIFDARVVAGTARGPFPPAEVLEGPRRPGLQRLLARLALTHRPPTGFLRDVIVESSGEHRGTFDVKTAGVLPIVDLARWAGIAAGATVTGTLDRLAAGADAGVLGRAPARTLAEAWELLTGLRLEHQVQQLRSGEEPDDHLDPRTLNPLARRYLREAFRAVAAVQKGIAAELAAGRAFGTDHA